MSLLLFVQEDERVVVVTDTLATDTDGAPHMFVTKCWPIPHMNTLIAATGTGAMLDRWVEFVRTRMIALDVVNLDLHTPDALRQVWQSIADDFPDHGLTTTIYHFGFDPDTERAVRFTYRSKTNFESERSDEPGFGMKPPPEHPVSTSAGLVEIAEAIREEQEALPPAERIYIGGDLYMTSLSADGIGIAHLHRFGDWPADWNAMCARSVGEMGDD